jgi:prophage antirepressor-like protein
MNQLSHFHHSEFGAVRAVRVNGQPWFVANDICVALTIANSRDALARLDDDEKGVGTTDTLGGEQQAAIINESGLYSLVLSSRKPEARRFKKWVTGEVLPSIRQSGGYIAGQEKDDPELVLAKALQVAQSVIDRKALALNAANHEVGRLQGVCNTIASQFVPGQTPPQFCKQLNGVNINRVNAALVGLGALRPAAGGGYDVTSYHRDRHLTLRRFEYQPGKFASKAVLTRAGAKWLYKLYLNNRLPMKASWDGSHVHVVFGEVAA